MNAPVVPPASNPNDICFSDDGEALRVTVRGATYVFRGETCRIVRAHLAQHDSAIERAAFYHGFLTAISMAITTHKEKPDGKTRQDEQP